MLPRVGLAAACLVFTTFPAWAVEPPKPSMTARSVSPGAIVIDGALDDAAWTEFPGTDGFIQQTPDPGRPALGTTTVWVAYDDANLFVAARLDDLSPGLIRADERHRDAELSRSDAFAILVDTYHDHQNGFFFETNPLGAQVDAIITREGAFVNRAWDGLWDVAARRTPAGWTVEFRLPFDTLRFHPTSAATWGIQFRRTIPHLRETSYWNPLTPEQTLNELSRAGHLEGVAVGAGRRRLAVTPYVKGAYGAGSTGPARWDVDHDAGADLRYGITPNLALDLTVNTDFAETEADRLQVKLDRFPLFFPERRAFFLEGRGDYEFGLSGQLQPFFSRRIGLDAAGRPVPLWGGGKVTGKVGRYGVGLLTMQSRADDAPAERFDVVRLTRDLGVRSQIGAIGTRREEVGGTAFHTVGADAAYNPTPQITTDGFWLRTDGPDDVRPGYAAFAQAQYRDPFWRIKLNHLRTDERFNPHLGFVRQTDLDETVAYVDVRPRPASGPVLEVGAKTELTYQTDTTGTMRYRSQYQRVLANFRSGDTILLSYDPQVERLQEPFDLRPGLTVPAGDYRYHHWNAYVASATSRPVSGLVSVLWGGFYGGRKTSLNVQGTIAPAGTLSLGGAIDVEWVRVPQGDFTARIISGDARWALTNRLVLNVLVQHDDERGALAANLRVAWEYRSGSYVHLIANPTSDPQGSAAMYLVKVTWLWESGEAGHIRGTTRGEGE